MGKFGQLKKFDVKGNTSEYRMDDFEMAVKTEDGYKMVTPVLHVKPATDINKEYTNARLKKTDRSWLKAARKGKLSEAQLKESRKQDRELYPKFVIFGWENVPDDNGDLVEYTPEDCRDFLDTLPDWQFDGVVMYCMDNSNFLDLPDDPEDMIKN